MLNETDQKAYAKEVATTIKQQIMAMDYLALVRWGGNSYFSKTGYEFNETIKSTTSPCLQFKVGGLAKFKGYITIAYNPGADDYSVFAWKVRKYSIILHEQRYGLYFTDLVSVLDEIIK